MKDDTVNKFFKEHKQVITDNGFKGRLMETLRVLPKPQKKIDFSRSWIIVSLFSLIGVLLFVLFGGSESLIAGLEQIFYVISTSSSITPEIAVSIFFLFLMFVGIGKFSIEELG